MQLIIIYLFVGMAITLPGMYHQFDSTTSIELMKQRTADLRITDFNIWSTRSIIVCDSRENC